MIKQAAVCISLGLGFTADAMVVSIEGGRGDKTEEAGNARDEVGAA